MIEKLVKLVSKILPWRVNPRVVEFGCHYLSGRQTTKTLLTEEIEITKDQILRSLACPRCKPREAHINQLFSEESEDNCVDTVMKNWFEHPTMGIVGGFNFDLRVEEDGVYADCIDTWDFNYSTAVLKIPLNKHLLPMVTNVLKGLKISYDLEDHTIFIKEEWLEHLNDARAFQTTWVVKLASLEEAENLRVRFTGSRRRSINLEYSLLEYSKM